MRLPDSLKEFFHFNSRERNGFTILMAILLGVAIIYFLMPHFFAVDGKRVSAWELDEARAFLATAERKSKQDEYSKGEGSQVIFEPFEFDPNKISKDEWARLGLNEKQVATIGKYQASGGHFEVKSDVLKLYPVDSALYQKLEPYILLPDKKKWDKESDKVVFEPFDFDPNDLSVEDWQKFGLTENQAKSIKKYEANGGHFEVKSDVLNLWQVDEELYERMKPYIMLPDEKKVWNKDSEEVVFEPFEFDPNGLPIEDWMKLGLTKKQAESVKRYEASGGYFEVKRDVLNLWQIDEELYEKLKPYILLPEGFERDFERYRQKAEPVKVEINSADTIALKEVRGIGSFYAREIVKYREELGGFHSLEQLGELWKMDREKLDKWKSQLQVDALKVEKININNASVEDLREHPYLHWKHANAIVEYRSQHGDFDHVEEIKEILIIDEERFEKIKHYLTIE